VSLGLDRYEEYPYFFQNHPYKDKIIEIGKEGRYE